MRIEQLSIGQPREVIHNGKPVLTSIFKSPVTGPRLAGFKSLDGDSQSNLQVHGGRNKALYAYTSGHYQDWCKACGRTSLDAAQFGENLTLSGARDHEVLLDARYRAGDAEVVVTTPRIPCFKLGIRWGDPKFTADFWKAGRLGFYLRVDKVGMLEAGDAFKLIDTPDHGFSVHGLWAVVYQRKVAEAGQALEQLKHLDSGWTKRLEQVARGV